MNIPEVSLKRVVIVGAGFAGLNLAKKLNKKKMQVVLLDKNNYHTFQPLLYQVATAGLEPDSIAHSVRTIFKNEKNFHFRIATVKNINTHDNIVNTDIGDLAYDYLVIATGSETNYYGNQNVENNAMAMKTIPQALDLRSLILQNFEASLLTDDLAERETLMNFIIVGGGPTGVELAGALAELKSHVLPNDYPDLDIRRMSVNLIDSGDTLLKGFSQNASQAAEKYLTDMEVNIWKNTRVKDYDGKNVITNNKTFQTTTLIWAAGVKGVLLSGIPEESTAGGRYIVDAYNKIKGHENIYAIGDISVMISEELQRGHPMVAQPAIQQGINLGKNLNKIIDGKETLTPFIYKNKGSMATIGRNKAVVDIGNLKFKGFFAWVLWMFVHLFSLVGFRNKIVALVNWVTQYFQYNKGVRLIIRPFNKKKTSPNTSQIIENLKEGN